MIANRKKNNVEEPYVDNKDLKFEDFLLDVDLAYHEFVTQIHKYLLENGCVMKMDVAKNGCLVSYSDRKKRVGKLCVPQKRACYPCLRRLCA